MQPLRTPYNREMAEFAAWSREHATVDSCTAVVFPPSTLYRCLRVMLAASLPTSVTCQCLGIMICALFCAYLQHMEKGLPSPRLQFELACLLSCSPKKSDMRESTELLGELLEIGFSR